jgi:hypothetical protein
MNSFYMFNKFKMLPYKQSYSSLNLALNHASQIDHNMVKKSNFY